MTLFFFIITTLYLVGIGTSYFTFTLFLRIVTLVLAVVTVSCNGGYICHSYNVIYHNCALISCNCDFVCLYIYVFFFAAAALLILIAILFPVIMSIGNCEHFS